MSRIQTLATPRRFRLRPCVQSHGWYQVRPFRWHAEEGVLERVDVDARGRAFASRVFERAGALLLETPAGLSVRNQAGIAARWRHMLALDWNLADFHSLCRRHPALRRVPALGAGWLLRAGSFWEDVSKTLCGTNIQWPQARKLMDNVCGLGPATQDGRNAWPSPEAVLEAGEGWLREKGRVGYRAPYMLKLARLATLAGDGFGRVELTSDEGTALKFLKGLPGIGPASAHYLAVLHGHFRPLSIDSLVRAYVKARYTNGRAPSDGRIRRLFAPYGDYMGLGYWWEFALASDWLQRGDTRNVKKGKQQA